MRVLFAHSFYMAFDDKQRLAGKPYPPLGTLIAAAMVREAGHEVELFDAMIAPDDRAFYPLIAQGWDALVLFEDNFNWLSKMCLSRMRDAAGRMITAAREAGALVLVAGSDASDYPEVFLRAGADYVIAGEAEFRVCDILAHHAAGHREPAMGPGICRLDGAEVVSAPPGRGERDLGRFPAPAWDLVDLAPYRTLWQRNAGRFSLNMMTTRGCPYRCNWCAKPIHGRRYDVRDPEQVAAELARLKQVHGAQHIWFTDDIFGLKPGWVDRFCAEALRRDAVLPYSIQARADLMKDAMVQALRRSGCETVWMGVESGSQKVLDAMDKDLQVAHIYEATRRLKDAGIEVCFFLQFGYPGEESEDILRTWKMVADLVPDQIGISVAYPLPGTPFYAAVADQLGPGDHWDHSHHMRPVHKAHFPAEFYPLLYDYFHQNHRRLRGRTRGGLRGLKDRWVRHRTEARLIAYGLTGVPFP